MDTDKNNLSPELNVEYVLSRWPETIPVFLKYRMGCVGCTMASYETLSNAAKIYKLPLNIFIQDLQIAVSSGR
jgi:hybrid cluster-associated redox disulfide protein